MKRSCPKCSRKIGMSKGVPYCKGCYKKIAYCRCEPLILKFEELQPSTEGSISDAEKENRSWSLAKSAPPSVALKEVP